MIPISLVKSKIERLKLESSKEINIKNRELLEERILVLEELLSEVTISDVLREVDI